MKIASFIARRWASASPFLHTRHIVRMGIASMGLCICVMIISVCILVGFKQEVSKKVFGFGSHIVVQPYWNETGSDIASVQWDSALQNILHAVPGIASAQPYAMKGALIRGKDESCGVFFKGLPSAFDTSFFSEKLRRGRLPDFAHKQPVNGSLPPFGQLSQQILISDLLAKKLEIDTGGRLRAYFVHEGELRPRAFSVAGIYATGLEKFDETYILCDIGQIQRINAWTPGQADGVDIRLSDPEKRHAVAGQLSARLPYRYSCFPCDLLFPEIFDWLVLIDANVWVLLIIMLIVCMICLTSLLFILIIERKPHIGILKAMGTPNRMVRNIFVQQTLFILGRGMIAGNALALLLCGLQKWKSIFRLDESVYYLDSVPIAFPWQTILMIDIFVLLAAYLLLYGISCLLNRVSPAQTGNRM